MPCSFMDYLSFLAPSAPPRKLSFSNVKNESFAGLFQQAESQYINGIFTKFRIRIVENRRDGTTRTHKCEALGNNGTVINSPGAESNINQSASNQSGGSGSGSRKRRAQGGVPGAPLRPTAGTEPTNQTGLDGNTGGSQIQIDSSWATASYAISNTETNTTTQVMLSIKSGNFSVTFSGLLSYTNYDVYIAACTKVGCGPTVNGTVRTDQSGKS